MINFSCSICRTRDSYLVNDSNCAGWCYRLIPFSGAEIRPKLSPKRGKAWRNIRNEWSSLIFVGVLKLQNVLMVRSDTGSCPGRMTWTRYLIVMEKNVRFFNSIEIPAPCSRIETDITCLKCPSRSFRNILTSSRYISTTCHWNVDRMMFAASWNFSCVFFSVSALGMICNSPWHDANAVSPLSSWSISASL